MSKELYDTGRVFLYDLGLRAEPVRPPDDCFLANAEDGQADNNDCLNLLWRRGDEGDEDDPDQLIVAVIASEPGCVTAHIEMYSMTPVLERDYARKLGVLIEWLS